MYRLRATCQQRQVLVRAVAWGYIMPISTGYKTNWQQSSTCAFEGLRSECANSCVLAPPRLDAGSMQARENRAHFPPPLLRLMCLLQSRTLACREACVDAPQEGRSGYGHGCRLLGAEWGPEFAMERAHKADEDDEGRAQEEDKSSDFDRRSKSAHTILRHSHLIVSSDAFCLCFYCRSLLLRQRNSRLYLACLTLSTYDLDAASVAAMGQPSELDKPSPGGAHSLASTLNSPEPTFVEKLA
ncbi:hypothetical protein DFH08DRAFT_928897 [Mycena albidolilacea]|uniref:Uncharacterized protein n=1 Tax=Mycena albidolilacea TaxID=1033008 RepID=A0AAD7AVP7_9AGAR|nr:hypothetical protein DFH08DRAFT_928897 [Mycena albidolilacea]